MNKIVGLDIGRQGMKGVFVFPAFIKVFCTCTLLLFLMSDLAVAVFCLFVSGHMFLVKASKGLLGLVLRRWVKWTGKKVIVSKMLTFLEANAVRTLARTKPPKVKSLNKSKI